jgi:light-regulated signal transduction histidine kinase (bacteriophytochrome)
MSIQKSDAIKCQVGALAAVDAAPGERDDTTHLSAELREAQAELRRLRAFLSHDLRQPLASLSIWAELLSSKHGAALDDQGRRYLRELNASVQRVAALLSTEVAAHAPASDPVKRKGGAKGASEASNG